MEQDNGDNCVCGNYLNGSQCGECFQRIFISVSFSLIVHIKFKGSFISSLPN